MLIYLLHITITAILDYDYRRIHSIPPHISSPPSVADIARTGRYVDGRGLVTRASVYLFGVSWVEYACIVCISDLD